MHTRDNSRCEKGWLDCSTLDSSKKNMRNYCVKNKTGSPMNIKQACTTMDHMIAETVFGDNYRTQGRWKAESQEDLDLAATRAQDKKEEMRAERKRRTREAAEKAVEMKEQQETTRREQEADERLAEMKREADERVAEMKRKEDERAAEIMKEQQEAERREKETVERDERQQKLEKDNKRREAKNLEYEQNQIIVRREQELVRKEKETARIKQEAVEREENAQKAREINAEMKRQRDEWWSAKKKIAKLKALQGKAVVSDFASNFANRTKHIYSKVAEEYQNIDTALPAEDNLIWKKPKESKRIIQEHMLRFFKMEKPQHSASACVEFTECEKATLETYQRAAVVPLMRLDSELIVADTGTGKTFMMDEIMKYMLEYYNGEMETWGQKLHEGSVRVVVVVPLENHTTKHREEMKKSPAWHEWVCTKKRKLEDFVDVYNTNSTKLVSIVTFIQAGNMALTKRLDDKIIIMDECHVLAAPKTHIKEVNALSDWLLKRKYKKLVGLTATPYVNIEAFAKLMNIFSEKDNGIEASEITELIEYSELSRPQAACAIPKGFATMSDDSQKLLAERLNVRVLYYSAERDIHQYPTFIKKETVFVKIVFDKDAVDNFTSARRVTKSGFKGWTPASLNHRTRMTKIINAVAKEMYVRLIPGVKALVFAPTHTEAQKLRDALVKIHEGTNLKYNFALLKTTPGLSKKKTAEETEQNEAIIKRYGAVGTEITPIQVLIAEAKFAVGFTFSDQGAGPRQLHMLQMDTAKSRIQMIGRAVRRCSHSSYPPHQRVVDGFTYLPKAVFTDIPEIEEPKSTDTIEKIIDIMKRLDPKKMKTKNHSKKTHEQHRADASMLWKTKVGDRTAQTCEQVLYHKVKDEYTLHNAIMGALYMASFGRDAFWERRPLHLKSQPMSSDDTSRLRTGLNKISTMARAGRAAFSENI